MLAPCEQAELPSLCTRPEDHRHLFPKPCLIPLLTQSAHGCDNFRRQGLPSLAVQRPFPLSPRECELPALLGLHEGLLLRPRTQGSETGRACTGTHTQRAGRGGTQNGFQQRSPVSAALLVPGSPARPWKPICSQRGKEPLHFSITMILTNTSSNK